MINEVKTIVQNYLNNAKLCGLMIGTVVSGGIKINEKLTIPDELIKGNLKDFVKSGDKVRLIRNHGGHEFYIVEIIGLKPVLKETTMSIEPITITIPDGGGSVTISNITVKDVSR
jgi:hypothetical protein